MNTNDLPPAARLATLIEAGRAANPGVGHCVNTLFTGLDMPRAACALGFAYLGAGHEFAETHFTDEAISMLGIPDELGRLVSGVNDEGASLDVICLSLREGELAKVPA